MEMVVGTAMEDIAVQMGMAIGAEDGISEQQMS